MQKRKTRFELIREFTILRRNIQEPHFLELGDALFFLHRIGRWGLQHHCLQGLTRDEITDRGTIDRSKQKIDGKKSAQEFRFEAVFVNVTRTDIASAPLKHRGKPIERRDEQNQILEPYALQSLTVNLSRHTRSRIGRDHVAEIQESHDD